jgi:hypothetical protein
MAETTASRNERVNDYIADVTHVSLHSAAPNASGSNEIAGGSPAYARQVPTFTAAAGGATDLAGALNFAVPTGASLAYYGLWKGTTFLGGEALSAVETYAGQGTYALTSIPISAP